MAIELADSEGIAAVTMHRLAALVGSKAMSLYRYIPSKDALLELMWDAAMADPPKLRSGRWRSKLTRWAAASFQRLEQHPWLIELAGSIQSVGPKWTDWLEAGLTAMTKLPLNASEKLAVLTVIDGHLRSAGGCCSAQRLTTPTLHSARWCGAVSSTRQGCRWSRCSISASSGSWTASRLTASADSACPAMSRRRDRLRLHDERPTSTDAAAFHQNRSVRCAR
ncbi:MAG: helix-turn-helix transcriptional regulator [Microbacterium sp.]|uniref:TetR/AcrR family transcriptional regulator n=1 Tax=Microbacterium sp. TaxID=51671 RepID=UPI001D596192|nr:TetR/AcrR family transcriptional regulator [Microbacterium sp.]MBW8760981.1 helix-turn-helix transcriptional regulator [Microbacterium sp.]